MIGYSLVGIGLKRIAILLSVVAGFALAQTPEPCSEAAFTLETAEGLIGGTNLELDEESGVSRFSDGACLEAKGIRLQAPEIRWDSKTQTLAAQNLEAQTGRYRFRAESGTVKGGVFSAQGILATTCKCGDDLRVLAQAARFDTESGNIILESAGLELYSLELARLKRYELDTRKPPSFGLPTVSSGLPGEPDTIRLPIVLGLGNGPNLGVQDFPWLGDGVGSSSFTLVGYNLFSNKQELRFGLSTRQAGASARVEMAFKSKTLFLYTSANAGPLRLSFDSENQLYTGRLQQAYRQWGLTFTPFAALTSELETRDNRPKVVNRGPTLGAELRYGLQLKDGSFGLRLEPSTFFTLYDSAPFYWTYGGLIEARYNEGFSLRLAYEHAQSFESRDSRFSFERRDPKSIISVAWSYQPLSLQASYDFLGFETKASARYGYRFADGELWTQGRLRFTAGAWTQQEILLGFNPLPLDCTYSFSLSPKLGYDWLRSGVSRMGLEARYADCCFIWKLGFEAVLIPQTANPKDDPGRVVFGIEIR
jgi:hypothetical protein